MVLTRPQGRFSEEGFLGPKYKPFATGGDPNAQRFEVEGVVAPGITDDRQKSRQQLLAKTEHHAATRWPTSPEISAAEDAKKRAYELILGAGQGGVRPLQGETGSCAIATAGTPSARTAWWPGGMVEAGVPYVVINYPGGWDTHSNHFATMRRQCPQLDQGLATLLADLKDRGLLESTLVWCCGEFGRGPKVDWQPPWNGGRNHYGNVFTVLVAGGGFKGGHVVVPRMRRQKRSRIARFTRSTCWAASTIWPASMPGQAPPSRGEADVLPRPRKV